MLEFIEISDISNNRSDVVVDVEGKYEKYFKENEIEAVVVRPDFIILEAKLIS